MRAAKRRLRLEAALAAAPHPPPPDSKEGGSLDLLQRQMDASQSTQLRLQQEREHPRSTEPREQRALTLGHSSLRAGGGFSSAASFSFTPGSAWASKGRGETGQQPPARHSGDDGAAWAEEQDWRQQQQRLLDALDRRAAPPRGPPHTAPAPPQFVAARGGDP